ncbi:SH3 domain-containing protein [Mycena floridula]|nr:SH3 domain-containing protein [Mycena floridula]
MTIRAQSSASSVSRYGVARSRTSRDFCNSFWGAGDAGVNILFTRMRGAARTTDDLRNFWRQRAQIEEEYSNSMFELAKMIIGKDEIGELRNALDTLKLETEKLGTSHGQLASQIKVEMEEPITNLLNKQIDHRRNVQAPLEKRFKQKQTQESYVVKAREKYQGDCIRITSYTQQIEVNQGRDIERIQRKLQTAQQTVQANERDYVDFSKDLAEMIPAWEADWKEFCDTCQDLEEERLEFMKDNLWTYANAVSTVCVADDLSCESVRTVLDQLEPERDIEHFVQEFGTGNSITAPPTFVPYSGPNDPQPVANSHQARFTRQSTRPVTHPPVNPQPAAPAPEAPRNNPAPVNGSGAPRPPSRAPSTRSIRGSGRGSHIRESVPLPMMPTHQPVVTNPPSPPPTTDTGGVLFYVKALYDYQATIEEEFDFQAGDVIAVTATPDDGWWSGELLDEARREEGRHIFPSNFVCLF